MPNSGLRPVRTIEDALQWMAGELQKQSADALAIVRGPKGCGSMFSNLVPSGSISAARPIGNPHPDALRLKAAVDALAEDLASFPPPPTLTAGLPEGHGGEAEWAKALREVAGTVMAHAKLGTAPKVRPGAPVAKPVAHPNGKPVMVRTIRGDVVDGVFREAAAGRIEVEIPQFADKSGKYQPGTYPKVAYSPPPQFFIADRAEYAVWRLALEHLADTVELATIKLSGPTAPARPWVGDHAAVKRGAVHLGVAAPVLPERRKVYAHGGPLRSRHGPVRHINPKDAA